MKNTEFKVITGAAGFIGSHTCEKMLNNGYRVLGIDNLNDYYDPLLKQHNLNSLKRFDNFKFIQADICDYNALFELFQDHSLDTIIHLAAQAGVRYSIENPFIYQQVNVGGTLNLLELARHFNIKNFVFASSSSVYGNQQKVPFSEDTPFLRPVSIYAATKQAGETLCYSYHHLYGININCLRLFTVYGPAGRPDMSPHIFTKKVLKEETIQLFDDSLGAIKRDFTYVSDIVDGILKASDHHSGFQIFNLGHGSPIKLRDFLGIIEELTGKTATIEHTHCQPGDVAVTYADITKAKKQLGFQSKVSIREGLERFVDWFVKYYNVQQR
ncbi:MAG: GDP-mannose 4,6-dehydratase [Candidatus Odinarchaeota archaeon]